MPWPALIAALGGIMGGGAAAGGAAAGGGGLASAFGSQMPSIMKGLDSANIMQSGLSGGGGLGATSGKSFDMGSVMTQLGGMEQPSSKPEDDLSWLEKYGIIEGAGDAYNKEMGIKDQPLNLPALKTGGGMQELMSMMKAAQSPQQQRRPRQSMQDMIMSGHLKTLMGG